MRRRRPPCIPRRPRTLRRGRYCHRRDCRRSADRRPGCNRVHHSIETRRSSHHPRSGSSSEDHRWRSRCRRRKPRLQPGCIRRFGRTAHRDRWCRRHRRRFRRHRWRRADRRSRRCPDRMSRRCCGSNSGRRRSRSRSMRRPPLPQTGCIGQSASIPRRVAVHRFGCSCRDCSRSRGRRNTRRCSRRRNRHRLHCGNSLAGRRRHSRCQRRLSLRHSGCIGKMKCTAPRERVRPRSSFPMRCRHRCR